MAKAAANKNPYAAPEEIRDLGYAMPNGEFAVPGLTAENGYMDSPIGAYSPALREGIGDTPDSMRIAKSRVRDFRPDPARAPETFWGAIDTDDKTRHSVEDQDADGFATTVSGSGKPAAPNPRLKPSAEPRPTGRLSPRTYTFTRPEWGNPRELTGEHFSMADHRRDYEILGTQPVRSWRNTYRIQPAPWDTDMVDIAPNDPTDVIAARIESVEVPLSRSFRLG